MTIQFQSILASYTTEQSKLAENEPSDSSAYKKMNGIHHRPTPAASSMISPAFEEKSKKLSQISEHAEYDDPWDNELSAEAQAHNISMFLSSTSDSGVLYCSNYCVCVVYVCVLKFVQICVSSFLGIV